MSIIKVHYFHKSFKLAAKAQVDQKPSLVIHHRDVTLQLNQPSSSTAKISNMGNCCLVSPTGASAASTHHGTAGIDISNVDISQLTPEQIEQIELGFFKKLQAVDTTRDVRFCHPMENR